MQKSNIIKSKLWLVHRFIVSVLINRKLLSSEQVNHKNGKTDDNRLCNLEVVTFQQNVQHAVANNLYCKGKDWYNDESATL